MRSTTRMLCTLAALLLAACGGSGYGSSSQAPPPPLTVNASPSLTFSPATLTVKAGDAVSFAFGSVGHNVFFDAQTGAPADISGSNANTSVERTFTTAGTYHYTCHIHPSMQGTIVVQ